MSAHANVSAQEYTQEYFQGIIVSIDYNPPQKHTKVHLTTGPEKGMEIVITQLVEDSEFDQQKNSFTSGDQVVISKITSNERTEYFISDAYRNNSLVWLGIAYAFAIILLSQWKGLKSLLGLGFTFLILTQFMIPQILAGKNPIIITIISSVAIMTASLYLTHGISKQTTVSLSGTLISLILASLLAQLMIKVANLTGLGTEEAMFLLIGETSKLNLRGLLLSGIIISSLGVIDDITVTQTAIVYELKKTKSNLNISELYKKGLNIGKEHIASVTNTLILAYAGASLPLFLLFYQNTSVPFWVALNSELVAEEIIATLVGSMGLVLSVPITTYLAATIVSLKKK